MVAASTPDAEERRWAEANLEGVKIYADFDQMLEKESLDAVVVASATSVHAEQALKAIAKGYHVLCEKPLSIDLKVVSIVSIHVEYFAPTNLLTAMRLGSVCVASISDFFAGLPNTKGHVRILTPLRCVLSPST